MSEGKLYVCESCGQSTPVDADECTNCGGKMVLFDDEMEPSPEDLRDEDLDSEIGMDDDPSKIGTESLEHLVEEEQEESDEEYRHDSFDDE